ncbi:MBL fold metallo-hydrolase [Pseudodesulfovibrio tunisiensis]|uniref:MBL fold metallo-hydrolase n=1 Tax=Pseudodesulfovibrio tunisiensis TaxID=463192 RepID=UPI001FB3C489|nr:MBL fold metallo-hydrolase [Pseudodesulfovibrio tunisiensis]
MEISLFPLGPLETNCYVLANGTEAVVVDPGGDPAPVLAHVEKHGLTVTHILNTHLHFDHTYGNKALAEATGAPILASGEDAYLLEDGLGRGGVMGLPTVPEYAFQAIEPGEFTFAGAGCTVFATPGHSAGSLTFHFPEAGVAFVGDLIFYRSIGRTDFAGGDLDRLKESVRRHIFTLPPETVLYSGHGPETTAGDEMNHNPFFTGF